MEKGVKITGLVLCVLVISVMFVPLVSAGWWDDFTDFFKKFFGIREKFEGDGELRSMPPGYKDSGDSESEPPADGEELPVEGEENYCFEDEECPECYRCVKEPDRERGICERIADCGEGGGGVPCIPKTCEELGKQCESWNDGCGRMLECGSCESGYICENGQCIEQVINNEKDMLKYSNKELFLISDTNWRDVLQLVPLTTWTQQWGVDEGDCQRGYGTPEEVCVYPVLIYHEEENILPFLVVSNFFGLDLISTPGSWQSFVAEDDYITKIRIACGNPGEVLSLKLKNSLGEIIAESELKEV